MLQLVDKVNGAVLWANLHLLFWLSLVPFATAWMGENHFATVPVALYGVALLMCSIAYAILARLLIRAEGPDSALTAAFQRDFKGNISTLIYLAAIPLAFVNHWIALALYAGVAAIWFVPDSRIEKRVAQN